MAFLSRLFKRGDPPAEREEARRQGMRDARRHPLTTFTDPEGRPAFVAEVRARAREEITEAGRRLAARRGELLEQALAAREAILLELDRTDLLPRPNGSHGGPEHPGDAFISIGEARWRREEARRREAVRESRESVRRAGGRIERYAQEWESALIEHDHAVAAAHARAERLIAAYRSGVMETHPRREEIPPLWRGEVVAVEPTGDTRLGISAREEMGRIRHEVRTRVTEWHTRILESPPVPSLSPGQTSRPEGKTDSSVAGTAPAPADPEPLRTEETNDPPPAGPDLADGAPDAAPPRSRLEEGW